MVMKQHLLLVTNGRPESLGAVHYGAWLAELLDIPVTLLGILDEDQNEQAVDSILMQVRERLAEKNLILVQNIVRGDPVEVICRIAEASKHLVVMGPLGRPGWLRWLRGRSFRYVLKEIRTPLIYVQAPHLRINSILVCMGGLGYASSVERWALYLARCSGASVTLLHISEPVCYDYATTKQIRAYGEEIIKSETPQGRNLGLALGDAEALGVPVALKVRHGDVIHEINAEISEQSYDLIAMGSPESSHSLRRRFMQNVTAQIAERGTLPVLVARMGQEPIQE